jgi:NADH-quinone oxidoreductase subunit K
VAPITLQHYLVVSGIVFSLGLFGVFWGRKTIISILMAIELMLLACNLNFVAFSTFLGDLLGQLFTLFILTVAAAEAAIGLAILLIYHRNRQTVDVEAISSMRG